MKLCHKMKVYRRGNNGTSRPEIRLLGKWIEKAGFSVGQEICVTISEDNKIIIEKGYTDEEKNLNDVYSYFDDEVKRIRKEEKNNLLKWIRDHGYIKSNSRAIDVKALTQKECGFKGKSCIVKKNGIPFDVLRDEAEEWGVIQPGTSTEEFGQMIKDLVMRA